MGFFDNVERSYNGSETGLGLCYEFGCKACPLNNVRLKHGKMKPTGAKNPLFYVLGEAPGQEEDEHGRQFIGYSGKKIRAAFKDIGLTDENVLWDNSIRCRPPGNRDPEAAELASCRGYIEKDIEQSKPWVIIGTGNVPLRWALGSVKRGITAWQGRWVPVKIRSHTCWFYPLTHPAARFTEEQEHMWHVYVCRMANEYESLPKPRVWTEKELRSRVHVVHNVGEVKKGLHILAQKKAIGIDVETFAEPLHKDTPDTAMRPQAPKRRVLSVAVASPDYAMAFPLGFPRAWSYNERYEVAQLLCRFLMLRGLTKIAHNLIFELCWFSTLFPSLQLRHTKWGDTMAMAYARDGRKGVNSLDVQSHMALGVAIKSLTRPLNMPRLIDEPMDEVLEYNALDALGTILTAAVNGPRMRVEKVVSVYKFLIRSSHTIAQMQNRGAPVSFKTIEHYEQLLGKEYKRLTHVIKESKASQKFERTYGRSFNPLSNRDVKWLFDKVLTIPVENTQEATLSAVTQPSGRPIAESIVKIRKVQKRHSMYGVNIKKLVFPDRRFHSWFNLLLVSTGRLSCEDPNLQNFPVRNDADKGLRNIVTAGKGNLLLSCDYGQIEARNIAMASQDEELCKALWNDFDIHMYWAKRMREDYPRIMDWVMSLTGCPEEGALKALRTEIKNRWVFPLFYSATSYSCSMSLAVPEKLATDWYKEFWDMYPGVRKWQKWLRAFYDKHGYVRTLTGRKRWGPMDYGMIVNSPIQGTASDFTVEASNIVVDVLNIAPIMNVHDDLTYEEAEELVHKLGKQIAKCMCSIDFDFINVPLVVEVKAGRRWGKMKEIAKYDSYKDFGIGHGEA